MKKVRLLQLILLSAILLTSCGMLNMTSKTPEEWVTLANSGLAGRDNYTYTVHVETGLNEGITIKTVQYNGQVKSHHEYSISSEFTDATLLHPAKYLDIISNKASVVSFQQDTIDAGASTLSISLMAKEKSEEATLRWRTLLRQQFSQLKLSSTQVEVDQHKKTQINELLNDSEQQLEDMLSTLQVESSFMLVINGKNAVPTVIEEYAILNYVKNDKPLCEYRKSTINLMY